MRRENDVVFGDESDQSPSCIKCPNRIDGQVCSESQVERARGADKNFVIYLTWA